MRPSVRYNSHRPWRFRRWLDRHESAKEWAPFEAPTICAQRSPCGTWSRSSIWGTVKLDTPQARTPLRPQKIWRSGAICFKVCEASQTGDEQKKINNSTYPRAAQWGWRNDRRRSTFPGLGLYRLKRHRNVCHYRRVADGIPVLKNIGTP